MSALPSDPYILAQRLRKDLLGNSRWEIMSLRTGERIVTDHLDRYEILDPDPSVIDTRKLFFYRSGETLEKIRQMRIENLSQVFKKKEKKERKKGSAKPKKSKKISVLLSSPIMQKALENLSPAEREKVLKTLGA